MLRSFFVFALLYHVVVVPAAELRRVPSTRPIRVPTVRGIIQQNQPEARPATLVDSRGNHLQVSELSWRYSPYSSLYKNAGSVPVVQIEVDALVYYLPVPSIRYILKADKETWVIEYDAFGKNRKLRGNWTEPDKIRGQSSFGYFSIDAKEVQRIEFQGKTKTLTEFDSKDPDKPARFVAKDKLVVNGDQQISVARLSMLNPLTLQHGDFSITIRAGGFSKLKFGPDGNIEVTGRDGSKLSGTCAPKDRPWFGGLTEFGAFHVSPHQVRSVEISPKSEQKKHP